MLLAERRRFPRFPFHSRAMLQINALTHLGTLVDISAKGCLFASDASLRFDIGMHCGISVKEGRANHFATFHGNVVHADDHLIGVEFRDLSEAASKTLDRILSMNLAPNSMVNREMPALLRR